MKLKHPYICIKKENKDSFGGSQTWFSSSVIKKYGCGRIAGQDLLLYLGRYHRGCQRKKLRQLSMLDKSVVWERYEEYSKIVGKWFPIIPYLGMPGWLLPLLLNAYFWRYHMPYRACWGVLPHQFWDKIEKMLQADLPVILAVGQNFPFFWGKKKLNFYQINDEEYVEVTKVKAHYVTLTGLNEEWMEISSWGKKYYIKREEYLAYVKKHSCWLFSNICYVYGRV